MKAVYFTNATDEDFSYPWDGQIMTFKSGDSLMMDIGKATHFAKHLAVRELNKQGKPAGKDPVEELAATYLTEDAVEAKSETELESKILTANDKAKKGKKAKKAKKKTKKEEKEEEFEDLK